MLYCLKGWEAWGPADVVGDEGASFLETPLDQRRMGNGSLLGETITCKNLEQVTTISWNWESTKREKPENPQGTPE